MAAELAEKGVNLFLWRPVLAGLCSPPDLRDRWTLRDVISAHHVLDVKEAAEIMASEEARKNARKRN